MNWVDVVIIAIVLFYVFEGFRRGFIHKTLELVGFVLTVTISAVSYKAIGNYITSFTDINAVYSQPIGFFIIWFVLQFIYSLILRFTYPLIPKFIRKSLANRILGIIPSFLSSVIIISVIVTFIIALQLPPKLKNSIDASIIGHKLVENKSIVENSLKSIFNLDVSTLSTKLAPPQTEENKIIDPNETLSLDFKTDNVTYDNASEQKMLDLVNQERVKAGVKPLVWDEKLAGVARAHSIDMFKNGYFGHVDLNKLTPFDRMEKAGISYKVAGENLAWAPSVDSAHRGLMNSPGHRENILRPEFGHIGIGVIDGGIYNKMFSQEFTD